MEFTEEQKIKCWVHYMTRIVYLNTMLYFEVNKRDTNKKVGYHYIREYNSFCEEPDSRVSEGLIGTYNRLNENPWSS
jgi:hypothetical protein